MTDVALETPKPRLVLALIASLFALGTPIIQIALKPLLEAYVPYPMNRFVSLWPFWIATLFAIFVSVKIEGIPLSTFGIGKNTRSLRYRLIELIAALLAGLVITIVLVLFSNAVRDALNVSSPTIFDPNSIPPAWVLIPAWMTAAFCEEFLFRSYPIERISLLTGNRWIGAIISLVAFVVFHIFGWDWLHLATIVFPAALIITGIYMWRRSLLFVVVIHAVFDLPLIFLPFLAPYL